MIKNYDDLIETKVNYLTIKEILYNYNNSGNTFVKCKCDCNNEKICEIYKLTRKNKKQICCGKFCSLINPILLPEQRTYGNLIILDENTNRIKNRIYVTAQCACKNKIYIPLRNILSGKRDCGYKCFKTSSGNIIYPHINLDLPCDAIYNLFIIDKQNTIQISNKYNCSPSIISKILKSYGIKKIYLQKGRYNSQYTGYEEISGHFWAGIKNNAKYRDIQFDIKIEDAWILFESQNKKCAISGINLIISSSKEIETTASLDRIDSSKGYTKDNVQWVHKIINYIKRDLSDKIFIEWCHTTSLFQKAKEN